ncbi:hypothetical protein ACLB1N_30265 [Escherichia coli]
MHAISLHSLAYRRLREDFLSMLLLMR